MEPQNLDDQFKTIVGSSEDYYHEYSDKSKNFIWQRVQQGQEKIRPLIWKQATIAASFLVIAFLSFWLYQSKTLNNRAIADLTQQIEALKKQNLMQVQNRDTACRIVTLTKERIVKVPVITKQIEEKIQYVRDTVIIKQIVIEYREKVGDNLITNDKNLLAYKANNEKVTSTEILLSNSTSTEIVNRREPSIKKFLKNRYGQITDSGSEPVSLKKLFSSL